MAPPPSQRLLSRRRVLQVGALGFVAGAGALAEALVQPVLAPPSARGPGPGSDVGALRSPSASPAATPDNRLHYLTRPDLTPPPVNLIHRGPRLAEGLIFFTPNNGSPPDGPMIVDDAGEPVWIHARPGTQATNLRVGRYQGEPALTWWEGVVSNGVANGDYVVADSSYREIARVRAANGYGGDLHEFFIGPDDTAFFLITNAVEATIPGPSGPIEGRATEAVIQEVDVASGRLLFEWHSLPSIDPSESYVPPPTDGSPFDYIHANSIDLDADGNLLLCGRHTWAIYKIDRGSGAILWRLNGRRSDFKLGDEAAFAWQHDARAQPEGISIFDDGAMGSPPQPEAQSRGIVLALDTAAMTARLAREFVHPAGLLSTSQGSFQLMPTGGAFVGWGRLPQFSEFDANGALALDAVFPAGNQSYRTYRFPWRGLPDAAPDIAAGARSDSAVVVYASWNGATEVAAWEVLGGAGLDALAPLIRVRRSGFETAIAVDARPRVALVRALDAAGAELGRSRPIAIS
jgi:hypothetical protein